MNLSTPVYRLPMVGPTYTRRLEKLRIENIEDLLRHVPHRYQDFRIISEISRVQIGETVTVRGKVTSIKNIYTAHGKRIQVAQIADDSSFMQAVWFNQTFLVKTIKQGELYSFSGKVDWFNRKKGLISPDYEKIEEGIDLIHTGRLVPVYPETYGVSSKWLRSKVAYVLRVLEGEPEEYLPEELLHKYSYPVLRNAIESVHFPSDIPYVGPAKSRLAFDELLFYQLNSLYRKSDWKKIHTAHSLRVEKKLLDQFKMILPFKLTASQEAAIKELLEDLEQRNPMNRLLEGDVGSGKTVVAAAGAFASFVKGYQSIFMAPTEILAEQHFNTLNNIFKDFKMRVTLVTRSGIKKDLGRTDVYVGTRALIEKKVTFDNVAYVVIDEQHRFGVEQRAHLIKRAGKRRMAPHVLTMTATPIPRTIVLTVYGDLDLSTLRELPSGRVPITTWLVPPQKREGAYEWIKKLIKKDRIQVFVICPLIEESQIDTMKQVRAATIEYENLKNIFSGFKVGLLHGKQTSKVKNEMIGEFKEGKIDILVSTPVVEVGIDVPNATIMIIEGSERFGLASLHQLRGRIGRGEKKSYCLLFTESKSRKALERLKALKENKSGFELAELDLQLRGPGEVLGTKQHGFPELKIATWSDTELIKETRKVAEDILSNPKNYPKLSEKISSDTLAPN